MKGALLLCTLLASLVWGGEANATLISGQISIDGVANYTTTTVSFPTGTGNIEGLTSTGTFLTAFASGCTGCVTLTDFDFASLTSPVTIYEATLNGVTISFVVTGITSYSTADNALLIYAVGYATETGYDDTDGTLIISSQGGQNTNVSFSATATATSVPEPFTIALLGLGMIGVGLARSDRLSFTQWITGRSTLGA